MSDNESEHVVDVNDAMQEPTTSIIRSGMGKVEKNAQATKKLLPRPLKQPVKCPLAPAETDDDVNEEHLRRERFKYEWTRRRLVAFRKEMSMSYALLMARLRMAKKYRKRVTLRQLIRGTGARNLQMRARNNKQQRVGPLLQPKTERKRVRWSDMNYENGWLVEELPQPSSVNIDVLNARKMKLPKKKVKRLTKKANARAKRGSSSSSDEEPNRVKEGESETDDMDVDLKELTNVCLGLTKISIQIATEVRNKVFFINKLIHK